MILPVPGLLLQALLGILALMLLRLRARRGGKGRLGRVDARAGGRTVPLLRVGRIGGLGRPVAFELVALAAAAYGLFLVAFLLTAAAGEAAGAAPDDGHWAHSVQAGTGAGAGASKAKIKPAAHTQCPVTGGNCRRRDQTLRTWTSRTLCCDAVGGEAKSHAR